MPIREAIGAESNDATYKGVKAVAAATGTLLLATSLAGCAGARPGDAAQIEAAAVGLAEDALAHYEENPDAWEVRSLPDRPVNMRFETTTGDDAAVVELRFLQENKTELDVAQLGNIIIWQGINPLQNDSDNYAFTIGRHLGRIGDEELLGEWHSGAAYDYLENESGNRAELYAYYDSEDAYYSVTGDQYEAVADQAGVKLQDIFDGELEGVDPPSELDDLERK